MESEFIRQAKILAEQVFKNRTFEKHVFHNLDHTRDVVNAVQIVGQHANLSADEMESALVAAWLHDIGYENGSKNHEQTSARKAQELLESLGAPQRKISEVTEAILATHMPQSPKSKISRVLCDADLYHLSTEQCQEKSNMLKAEREALGTTQVSNEDWVSSTIAFMKDHAYHTSYGQTVLEERKRKNIKKLKNSLGGEISPKKYRKLEEEVDKLKNKLQKERELKPDRGIETMFRTTSHNHIMLSQMRSEERRVGKE